MSIFFGTSWLFVPENAAGGGWDVVGISTSLGATESRLTLKEYMQLVGRCVCVSGKFQKAS